MAQNLFNHIRSQYGAVAASELSADHAGVRAVAEAFGYTPEELAAIPSAANMGLSCGNPTAFANLRPGETVLDLGCGGGLDVLLAALSVGPAGKAIGIDMTPAMIERARANARQPIHGQMLTNVEFHLGSIDRLPLADATVDCLVSNCVINLASDKSAVFREMFRVLKPGGRVAVCDIALKQALPEDLRSNLAAQVGCIGGAILLSEYERGLRDAGFKGVQVIDGGKDLNAYALVENQVACCSPAMQSATLPAAEQCCETESSSSVHHGLADLLKRYDINSYAASVYVYALKGSSI